MKWWEVVTGCDGYYSPKRFRTEEEAEDYANEIEEFMEDIHVSEGPYKVNTEDTSFFYHLATKGEDNV